MPDPFKIEFQARTRPFPVPEMVAVDVDGMETKYLPLSALPRETLVAMVEEWRAKVMGAETPAPEQSSDPDLIRVGEDGDPIRVEFRREGGRWVYRCLHLDEALRGCGVIKGKVISASHPGVYSDGYVCLHGRTRSRDAETCEFTGIDPHAFAAAVREAMPAARRMVEEAKR